MNEIAVDVYGNFAMFTRPESKVERATYKVPTPSACRGILNAIYCKPVEFYYQITSIEVMKPVRTLCVKKNELKVKANASAVVKKDDYFISLNDNHTQRVSEYLVDVYYRIKARIVLQPEMIGTRVTEDSIVNQFNKRVEHGKCFYQPFLGTRECMCFFKTPDYSIKPIDRNESLGIMLYDVFDITKHEPMDTRKKTLNLNSCVSFFNADMANGTINVPEWDSNDIYIRRNP